MHSHAERGNERWLLGLFALAGFFGVACFLLFDGFPLPLLPILRLIRLCALWWC